MAARPQCRNHGCRRVCFKHHSWAGLDPETRCIDSRLRVTAQIDQLLHHLDMALRLHISAHNAKTGKRLVLAGEIGRAACGKSVSVRVDLGGRRIVKKKNKEERDTRDESAKNN